MPLDKAPVSIVCLSADRLRDAVRVEIRSVNASVSNTEYVLPNQDIDRISIRDADHLSGR